MSVRALLIAVLSVSIAACSQSEAREQESSARALSPLHFSDGTSDLMLTWVGPRGDTHVETRPELVPEASRGFVRVLIADNRDGTTDPIYVADLGAKEADGGYTARSFPRAEWEAEIHKRREQAGALADDSDARPRGRGPRSGSELDRPPTRPEPTPTPSGGATDAPKGVALVTIYGASWCGPCHQALDHLKHLGVRAEFKDIEADPSAAREMQAKLEKAGGRRGAIPVIDVGGKILVGYSEPALDQALRDLRGGTAL